MQLVKRLAKIALSVLAIVLVLATLGTLIPNPFVYGPAAGSSADRRILVISSAIHTDIAIPLDAETLSGLAFLANTGPPLTHPDARWLLIGWGGRSFYLETPNLSDIRPGPTFRALTIDRSVMHVDVWGAIDETDPSVMALPVSEDAYANLLTNIAASFTQHDGKVLPIDGYGFGTTDKFYEGEGSFNALLGCNVWTSRMLRSAGIRTGLWDPLPILLTTSLRLFNNRSAVAPG